MSANQQMDCFEHHNPRKMTSLSEFVPFAPITLKLSKSYRIELFYPCSSEPDGSSEHVIIEHAQHVFIQVISLQWEVNFLASCTIEQLS